MKAFHCFEIGLPITRLGHGLRNIGSLCTTALIVSAIMKKSLLLFFL